MLSDFLSFAQGPGLNAQVPAITVLMLVAFAILAIMIVIIALLYFWVLRIWLKCMLGGAPIMIVRLVSMKMRQSPVDEIVRVGLLAAHSGVTVTWDQLETAAIKGVNLERAVLAMIKAKDAGQPITWEELVETDLVDRAG